MEWDERPRTTCSGGRQAHVCATLTLDSWTRQAGWAPLLRWQLCRPFRAGARMRSLPRGRGFLSRLALSLAWRTVEPGSVVWAKAPGGVSLSLDADTMIARAIWTFGAFEPGELDAAFRLASPGTYAFDVGANIGLFASVMSRAVGPMGRVIAVEPAAGTVLQLRGNLERNQCNNVEVVEGAAAAAAGDTTLTLTDDPALHSAGGTLLKGHRAAGAASVRAYTLDDLWVAAGQPSVSLVKIDVEGGEQAVLLGATQMISRCQPTLIIEVNDPTHLQRVAETLHGYRTVPGRGFEPWNHLMVPG